jgi:beta-phosphoglucomutase-like phosphatase (HAD superfamily)
MKTIIFKFNNILFHDWTEELKSWQIFAEKFFDFNLTKDNFIKIAAFHNYSYHKIINDLAGKKLDKSKLNDLLAKKSVIYQNLCLENKLDLKIDPAAKFLLTELQTRKVKLILVMINNSFNFDFYLNNFALKNYFKAKDIIFLKDFLPGPPQPNFYQELINEKNLSAQNTIVFENTRAGIKAAQKANLGNIIIFAPKHRNFDYLNIPEITDIINSFYQFNRLLLRE